VKAADLSRLLAEHVDQLAAELLSGGHREGREWRAGSVSGEPGASLQLHLTGDRRGRWCDYAADQHGDLLDLIGASLDLGTVDAMAWARRWLGIEDGEAVIPMRPAPAPEPEDPDRWRHAWNKAVPIAGTKAEIYLSWRMLSFDDREGDVMRFAARRARKNVAGELEHHPALLIALRDIRDGEQVGMTNVYLRRDGTDRLRDRHWPRPRRRHDVVSVRRRHDGLNRLRGRRDRHGDLEQRLGTGLGDRRGELPEDIPGARRDRELDHRRGCRSRR
jgi:hypothetical protein